MNQGRAPLLLAAWLLAAACGSSTSDGRGAASDPPGSARTSDAAPGTQTAPSERASTAAPAPTGTEGTASPAPSATNGRSASPAPTGDALAGARWVRPASAAGLAVPDAREDHTWTLAPDGESAYLFGGRAGARVFGDLWRYDLATDRWEQMRPAGDRPDARFGHTATWVDGHGLVVWSGQAGAKFFDDLWAFDAARNSWRELPGRGERPAARYGACAAVGPDGRLWVSHGFTHDGRFHDTRTYDFGAGRWEDLTPPRPRPVERCLHDCLWAPDGRFLLYAGQTNGVPALGDLWALSPGGRRWQELPQPEPPPRQLYALATDATVAYVYGGAGPDGSYLGDLWRLDLGTLVWTQATRLAQQPDARSGATLLADPARRRLLLFGGQGRGGHLADVWELQLAGEA